MRAMAIRRGSGFRALLRYLFKRDRTPDGELKEPGRLIATNLAEREDYKLMAEEMEAIAAERPDIKRPTWHAALRLPKGEGPLDAATWMRIVRRYLTELGVDVEAHQYVVVAHDDEDGYHVHIALNRVSMVTAAHGRLGIFYGRDDRILSSHILDTVIEPEFGLRRTHDDETVKWLTLERFEKLQDPTPEQRRKLAELRAEKRRLDAEQKQRAVALDAGSGGDRLTVRLKTRRAKTIKRGEAGRELSTGLASPRRHMTRILLAALDDPKVRTLADFVVRAERGGITVLPAVAKTGTVSGLVFNSLGVALKGSRLSRELAWGKLSERLRFDPARDRQLIAKLVVAAKDSPPPSKPMAAADLLGDGSLSSEKLRRAVITAANSSTSITSFLSACQSAGIAVIPTVANARGGGIRVSGLRFALAGVELKASQIDKTLAWSKLEARWKPTEAELEELRRLQDQHRAAALERVGSPEEVVIDKAALAAPARSADTIMAQHREVLARVEARRRELIRARDAEIVAAAKRRDREAAQRWRELVHDGMSKEERRKASETFRHWNAERTKAIAEEQARIDARYGAVLEKLVVPSRAAWTASELRDVERRILALSPERCGATGDGGAPAFPPVPIASYTARRLKPLTFVEYANASGSRLIDAADRVLSVGDAWRRDESAALALLQLARSRWPEGFDLTGTRDYVDRLAAVAVKHRMEHLVRNPELQERIAALVADRDRPPAVAPVAGTAVEDKIGVDRGGKIAWLRVPAGTDPKRVIEAARRQLGDDRWIVAGSPGFCARVNEELRSDPALSRIAGSASIRPAKLR